MHTKIAKKIFIVDDDQMQTALLEDYLTREIPHEIEVFNTGEDCIKRLAEQPDIVILDYNLNSVFNGAANGIKILEAIKKIDRSIRVIMLSSQDDYGVALLTVTKGAEDYIIKDEDAFEKIAAICRQ